MMNFQANNRGKNENKISFRDTVFICTKNMSLRGKRQCALNEHDHCPFLELSIKNR